VYTVIGELTFPVLLQVPNLAAKLYCTHRLALSVNAMKSVTGTRS